MHHKVLFNHNLAGENIAEIKELTINTKMKTNRKLKCSLSKASGVTTEQQQICWPIKTSYLHLYHSASLKLVLRL